MTEEIATADAEAGKISVDKTNISVTDFAQQRIGELTPKTEQPKEEEPPPPPSRFDQNADELEEEEEEEDSELPPEPQRNAN